MDLIMAKVTTKRKNYLARFLAIAIGAAIFAAFTPTIAHAIETGTLESLTKSTNELKLSVDTSWVLITGFLVFFMLNECRELINGSCKWIKEYHTGNCYHIIYTFVVTILVHFNTHMSCINSFCESIL